MSAPPPIRIDPIIVPTTLFDNPNAVTDELAVVTVAPAPRPAYLAPLLLPGYGTKITRIGGDYGTTTAIGGKWGKQALHHYSKDQPWNDDLSMIYIEQRDADSSGKIAGVLSPTKLILDGASYRPIIGNKNSTNNNALLNASNEFRWRPGYPDQAIGWNNSTQVLTVFRLVSQQIVFRVHIPHTCVKGATNAQGEGLGLLSEGVISNDGRYLVLCTTWYQPQVTGLVDQFCVVDIEAGIAGVGYSNGAGDPLMYSGNVGVGPWNSVPMIYRTIDIGDIDFASISPFGGYVIVKYSSRETPEYARCFNVNPSTLVCTPRVFVAGDNPILSGDNNSAFADPRSAVDYNGWLACMSHGDFAISSDPALGTNVEVYVGGLRIYGSDVTNCSNAEKAANGVYVAQSMATGKHIHVSMGTGQLGGASETADQHTSGRCYKEPAYILATYEYHATRKFGDELVLWPVLVNGGSTPVRCGTTRTDDNDLTGLGGNAKYLGEAHGCPSPGCEKIMFASNWQKNASPAGPPDDYKSYILESSLPPPAVAVGRRQRAMTLNTPLPYLTDSE